MRKMTNRRFTDPSFWWPQGFWAEAKRRLEEAEAERRLKEAEGSAEGSLGPTSAVKALLQSQKLEALLKQQTTNSCCLGREKESNQQTNQPNYN